MCVKHLVVRETGRPVGFKAAGGIRAQFADELNVRIALRSLVEFERFEELTGAEIAFRQYGYLFLLTDRYPTLASGAGFSHERRQT